MDFFLSWDNGEGKLTFPVIPSDGITLKRDQDNTEFNSINGRMQTIGDTGLASFELSSFFPMRKYSFARPGSWYNGWLYVTAIENIRARKIPFRAVYIGNNEEIVFNLPVTIDSFSYGLNTAGDVEYTLTFTEYRFAKTSADALGTQEAIGTAEKTAAAPTVVVQTDSQAAESTAQGFTKRYTDSEATIMAKIMFNESRGILSRTEIACIGWTICNRVDGGYGTLYKVMTAPKQFAYTASAKTISDRGYDLLELAKDVLNRWSREKSGQTGVGRCLPAGYYWYWGNGKHNYFFNKYSDFTAHATGRAWAYTLKSPYAN